MSRRRRRVQDKWRKKDWYNIYSPSYFGEANLGSVPCDDPDKMQGRVIETTLYDLTGDFSQQHVKLFFKVIDIKGNDCYTFFNGHDYSREYLRGLVVRRSSRIDDILSLTTKDGYKIRVSVVAISNKKAKTSQALVVRKIIQIISKEKARDLTFEQFVREVVLGKIASDIYNDAKKVIPLKYVGIRKSKFIASPMEKLLGDNVNGKQVQLLEKS